MEFIGWVPNISGRISFQTLSSSHLTVRKENAHIFPSDNSPRFVLANHRRVTNDTWTKAVVRSLFPPVVAAWGLKIDWYPGDTFDFIFLGRTAEDDDELVGDVYVLKPLPFSGVWRRAFETGYARLRSISRTGGAISGEDCDKLIAEFRDRFARENSAHAMTASIRICRDGKCIVDVPDDPVVLWPTALQRATYAFMFIRDLFHSHYHHADTDDALVPVCAKEADCWERETEKSLYRAVLGARRLRHIRDLIEAEGRLAYLKSFRATFVDKPKRDLERLGESIKASLGQEASKAERNTLLISLGVAIPFLLFEVLVHVLHALDRGHDPKANDQFANMLLYAYDHIATNVVSSLCLLYLLLAIYGSYSGILDIERWRLTRAVTRAFTVPMGRQQEWAISTMAATAVAIMLAGFAMIFWPKSEPPSDLSHQTSQAAPMTELKRSSEKVPPETHLKPGR